MMLLFIARWRRTRCMINTTPLSRTSHAELIKLIISKRYKDIIRVVTTGVAGIEVAQQEPPDIAIVRLMFQGIDGYEICQRLKAIPTLIQVPVLLFAARDPQDVYPEAQCYGAAGYLYQPYHPDSLYAARNALLRGETYYPPLSDGAFRRCLPLRRRCGDCFPYYETLPQSGVRIAIRTRFHTGV
jgi:DNA-binding response OmpR family regulator